MHESNELRYLRTELSVARASITGRTFADAPEVFKDIESLKARIVILVNPNHYVEKYQAWADKRASRRKVRA